MLGVCFESEHVGWMQDQWSWVFSNFGITDIWEYQAVSSGERGKDGSVYQSTVKIDSADQLPSDWELVIMAPADGRFIRGEVPLNSFEHPEKAIYLFGGSRAVLTKKVLGERPATLVYIPTVKHEMYSHAAGYVTLWDRYVKRGDFG